MFASAAIQKIFGLARRRMVCLLSLVYAWGFLFSLDFISDCLGRGGFNFGYDNSAVDNWLLILFLSCTVGAAIALVVGGLCRAKRVVLLCRFLFLFGACLSIWFSSEIRYLSDRTFFLFNEPDFESELSAAGNEILSMVLHSQQSASSFRLFVYSSHPLPEGRLSLDDIDALGKKSGEVGGELDEMRSCKIYAERLKEKFYVLLSDCG